MVVVYLCPYVLYAVRIECFDKAIYKLPPDELVFNCYFIYNALKYVNYLIA